jgi:hypothetical protein
MSSYCNFGHVFKTPDGIEPNSPEAYEYLIGGKEKNFRVKEIELFQVIYL